MVNRLKLNEKTMRDAELRPGVSYQIFDTEVIGFAVRVQASGGRTFTIDYRHAGRQRRMNIGPLRANKRETIEWLKFTLEGAGERTHGYAFTDTTFAGFWI